MEMIQGDLRGARLQPLAVGALPRRVGAEPRPDRRGPCPAGARQRHRTLRRIPARVPLVTAAGPIAGCAATGRSPALVFPRVPQALRGRGSNHLSFLNRWKIRDNLRRSLLPAANLALLLACWFISPRAGALASMTGEDVPCDQQYGRFITEETAYPEGRPFTNPS